MLEVGVERGVPARSLSSRKSDPERRRRSCGGSSTSASGICIAGAQSAVRPPYTRGTHLPALLPTKARDSHRVALRARGPLVCGLDALLQLPLERRWSCDSVPSAGDHGSSSSARCNGARFARRFERANAPRRAAMHAIEVARVIGLRSAAGGGTMIDIPILLALHDGRDSPPQAPWPDLAGPTIVQSQPLVDEEVPSVRRTGVATQRSSPTMRHTTG